MKIVIVYIVIVLATIFVGVTIANNTPKTLEPDDRTRQLCREWAQADHRGTVPQARYDWLGGDEYWYNFDWYGSCLLNNGRKVAK